MDTELLACPGELWNDRSRRPEFWYLVYHTLFFLDLYLTGSLEGFAPPAPFTLDEVSPPGLLSERPHTKDELQTYLEHGRKKCQRCAFEWVEVSVADLLLILRQRIDSAPGWVARTKD